MCSAHHEREARNPFNSARVCIGPEVKGTGGSKNLDASSFYLRLILKHSDTKLNKKHIVDQNLEGVRLLRPLWIRYCYLRSVV